MTSLPDDDTILDRFRQWLSEVRAEAESLGDGRETPAAAMEPQAPAADGRTVGWLQLVAEFTALRHELKLQTKSSRGLEEQTTKAVAALQDAIGQFRAVEAKENVAAERAAKPLVEALADLDEALRRGEAALESARRRIVEESAQRLREQLQELAGRQSGLRRWLCRDWKAAVEQACLVQATETHGRVFASLLEGYELIRDRLARTMKAEGIERIPTVGRPFDPNTMTALELVDDPDRPAGLVVGEVRPGYTWKGRILRFAEVRAVGRTAQLTTDN